MLFEKDIFHCTLNVVPENRALTRWITISNGTQLKSQPKHKWITGHYRPCLHFWIRLNGCLYNLILSTIHFWTRVMQNEYNVYRHKVTQTVHQNVDTVCGSKILIDNSSTKYSGNHTVPLTTPLNSVFRSIVRIKCSENRVFSTTHPPAWFNHGVTWLCNYSLSTMH